MLTHRLPDSSTFLVRCALMTLLAACGGATTEPAPAPQEAAAPSGEAEAPSAEAVASEETPQAEETGAEASAEGGRPDLSGLDLGEGWLGVALEAVEGEEAAALGLTREGIRVTQVFPGTPAAASEFQEGDLVLAFDDDELRDVGDLIARVRSSPPGTTIAFTVRRGDETFVQPIMLGLRPEFDDLLISIFVGEPAPPVQARQLADDTALDLGEGEVVVIDFWATWCGPCRRALPTLNELHARYAPLGVRFIGLSAEEPAELRAFLTETPIEYTVAYDLESETTHNFFITAYPTLFVIDRTGTVRHVFIGGDDLPQLAAALEAMMDGAGTPAQ